MIARAFALLLVLAGCIGETHQDVSAAHQPGTCSGAIRSQSARGPAPIPVTNLTIARGFRIEIIAAVRGARELAAMPNGDLLVGTTGTQIDIVPNAEGSGSAGAPSVFATLDDAPAAGVAFDARHCTLYAGSQFGIYALPYSDGARSATPTRIAKVRQEGGGGHVTTSVAVSHDTIYASVGSSCDACSETDPTRATIQQLSASGARMSTRAHNIRNAIALAVNPQTGTLWAGDAGQDGLPEGHPFEFFDGVTTHRGVADYGWPRCEENHNAFGSGARCTSQIVPAVEFPAYSTIIGAAFYPRAQRGVYAFPQTFRGGAFLGLHGSWHTSRGVALSPPRVAFVPMNGDTPRIAVNWSDPTAQWEEFVGGFQTSNGTRVGRPTGIAVGAQGSLFVADDDRGVIYRIRPLRHRDAIR